MKRIYFCFILFLLSGFSLYAQYDVAIFKLMAPDMKYTFVQNTIFEQDTIIKLNISQPIYGLSVSGITRLIDENSFVRITVKDCFQNEYLVYENYSLLSDDLVSTFDGVGIETVVLDNMKLDSLVIRVENATIELNELQYNSNRYASRGITSHAEQNNVIVDKLNQHLKARNKMWRAGVTPLSEMTYGEKKQIFGGSVPYLGGWEYYKSGIFVMPGYRQNKKNITPVRYVKEFTWTNRHGKNWVTPAKSQRWSTCWTFAPIATVESYINLYYNRLLNYDLSEQDIISCADPNYNPQVGGYIWNTLSYIRDNGVVEETCFPFIVFDDCINKCKNPNEIIKIAGYKQFDPISEEEMMKYVLKSPVCLDLFISSGGHSVLLVGYKTIQEGDRIQVEMPSSTEKEWINIEAGNPLIGSIAWLIKNSLGAAWGTNGFGYIITDNLSSYMRACAVSGKIYSLIYTDDDIIYEDNDGDGYYNWGIGDKPGTLPLWVSNEADGDDSNPNVGPMDDYGNLRDLNPDLLSPQVIKGDLLWDKDDYIHSHLTITSSGKLTVSSNVSMYKGAKIIIESGGVLIVDGGKIIRADVTIKSGGHLILTNGGILQKEDNDEFSAQLGAIIEIPYGSIQ